MSVKRIKLPPGVWWKADADYLDKLAPDERAWYMQFVNEFYSGDFRGDTDGRWSQDERRAIWRSKKKARKDVMTASPAFKDDLPDNTGLLENLMDTDDTLMGLAQAVIAAQGRGKSRAYHKARVALFSYLKEKYGYEVEE